MTDNSTYAIVESGGKQYRVEKGDSVLVDRLPDDEGAKVQLRAVMFRGADKVVLEPSELEKVKVEAKVSAHERGSKVHVFKYKAKKGYRRRQGHRSELTRLEVMDVKLLQRRPAKKKAADEDGKQPAAAKSGDKAAQSSGKAGAKAEGSGTGKPAKAKEGAKAKPSGDAKGKAKTSSGAAKSGGSSGTQKRKTPAKNKED